MASLTQTRLLYQIRRKLTANVPSTARANCRQTATNCIAILLSTWWLITISWGGRPC